MPISIIRQDITTLTCDAIVNAANKSLLGGGGVDGAIHRAAGPLLYKECKTLNGCESGQSKITSAYNLPSKFIIHTVGPQDGNPSVLESCYNTCLELVLENNIKSIAFPCIATGIYGYPNQEGAELAYRIALDFCEQHPDVDIIFCVFLKIDQDIYKELHGDDVEEEIEEELDSSKGEEDDVLEEDDHEFADDE